MSDATMEHDDELEVNITQSNLPPRPPTGADEVSKTTTASTKMPRRTTQPWAEVWQHFTKFTNDQGQVRGRCNYCKKELAADPKMNGTSSLNNHRKICKKAPRESKVSDSSGGTQTELVLGVEGEGSLDSWKFDQEAVKKAVAMMIITDELPFQFVEAKGFKKCFSIACPRFQMPSCWTIARDSYKIYNDLKISLKHTITQFTIMGTSILGGKYMHMRCMAYIINLIVSDGLKELNVSVARVRGAVKYVRASPSRLAKFKSCVTEVRIQSKALLCMDVCTHWNSTFLMLNAAEKFERAFQAFDSQDSNYGSELATGDGVPTTGDWEVCRKFCRFLEQFHTLTVKVSGSKYVTSNCFLDHISTMCKTLKEWQSSEDEHFGLMAKRMLAKFNKYWGDLEKVNMIVYFAIVIDPTKKIEYLEWLIEMMCSEEETSMVMNKIQKALFELFAVYKMLYSEEVGDNTTQVLEMTTDTLPPKATSLKSTFKKQKVGVSKEDDSELVTYLDDKRVDDDSEDYDVLLWWKLNHLRFPILSKIVRDVMAVPISTVASESAFSTGGRVLDAYRSSLTPKVVQALICSQDWMHSFDGECLDIASIFEPENNIEQLQEFDSDLNQIAVDPVLES